MSLEVTKSTICANESLLHINLPGEYFQLSLRSGLPWETRYSSKFIAVVDKKKEIGTFVVTYLENNNTIEYVRVQVKIKGQPLIRTDSRECDDYYTEKYSVEYPLPPDNPYAIYDKTPGIACFKLVDLNDRVVGQAIFEKDGKVSTYGMKLVDSF